VAPVTAKNEKGAFVLLAAGKERKFDTLAEAVQRASDGDTIEVRGNGPFLSPLVNAGKHALTIRAGATFRPVIRASPADRPMNVGLLITEAPLALEGIEFQLMADLPKMDEYHWPNMIQSNNAPLYVANCKFRYEMGGFCLMASGSPVCVVQKCEFTSGQANALRWASPTGGRCLIDNCILIRTHAIALLYHRAGLQDVSIRLSSNTVVGATFPIMTINLLALPNLDGVPKKPVRIESQANIFDGHSALALDQHPKENTKALEAADAEAFLSRLVDWQEQHNLYSTNTPFVTWFTNWGQTENHGPKSLAEWNQFWGQADSKSLEGQVHYQGGNLLSHEALVEQLTPEDFRLRPDSAGYRGGKDGKDLGADVDLVGPGPAYERWKKTPAYQEWLKETDPKAVEAKSEVAAAKRELAKWQGEWENPDLGRLIINGDRWSWQPKDGPEVVSTLKIVEVTDKMTHALLLNTGLDGKVRTVQTILRLDGDTLHNCGTVGPIRPTEFAHKTGYLYVQWKRVTKAPP
jgi:hypothetical protein